MTELLMAQSVCQRELLFSRKELCKEPPPALDDYRGQLAQLEQAFVAAARRRSATDALLASERAQLERQLADAQVDVQVATAERELQKMRASQALRSNEPLRKRCKALRAERRRLQGSIDSLRDELRTLEERQIEEWQILEELPRALDAKQQALQGWAGRTVQLHDELQDMMARLRSSWSNRPSACSSVAPSPTYWPGPDHARGVAPEADLSRTRESHEQHRFRHEIEVQLGHQRQASDLERIRLLDEHPYQRQVSDLERIRLVDEHDYELEAPRGHLSHHSDTVAGDSAWSFATAAVEAPQGAPRYWPPHR